MKKTPDSISKDRQKLGQEMDVWRAAIKKTTDPAKVSFGEAQVARCKQELRALGGKRRFFTRLLS